ncbi:protein moxZ [Paracoccus thiocyanatus]|uniref:Protein moxZ n=1 Tax=Paracoccus thiocyanatus TaxID=34006 RepID=A0A3D8PBD9_9RHOB|nr:protein moxZ [Paracoccus thiocyanatus]
MRFCRGTVMGRSAAGMAILLVLSACYDEDDQTLPSAVPGESVAAQSTHWLEVGDTRSPETFLSAESGLPAQTLAPLLGALSAHYRESPRMIANRVLQLWQEYPDTSLERMMTDLVPAQDAPEESLGPIAQQYRVLRAGGVGHADAVAAAMGQRE